MDKPGSTGTRDLVDFYENVFGTIFEGVDWRRPLFLRVSTRDLINSEQAFLTPTVEYIDSYLELNDDSTEEDAYVWQHSAAGYALRQAHKAIENQRDSDIKVDIGRLLRAMHQLWRILS